MNKTLKAAFAIATLAILSFQAEGVDFSCNPADDCNDLGVGASVPDPDDCRKYYLCMTDLDGGSVFPSDSSLECPENQYFNMEKGNCTDDGGKECADNCLNICKTQCTEVGEFVAKPGSCTNYYLCTSLTQPPSVVTCPDSEGSPTYFNGTACDPNEAHCCDTCTPYCEAVFIETYDPTNCHAYYICTAVGVPTSLDRYLCPEGEFFDNDEGKCAQEDSENPCESPCPTPSTTPATSTSTTGSPITPTTYTTTSPPPDV